MESIEFLRKYLENELAGYIELCGEDDDVSVAPCRKALEELTKVEQELKKHRS